jgi:hypothetical protein
MIFIIIQRYVNDQIFIADTRAYSHMGYSKVFPSNFQAIDTKVSAGINKKMTCSIGIPKSD